MTIDRRSFIRIVGGMGLTSTVPFRHLLLDPGARREASGVLVEAASFAEPGGWNIDTQHYQQMGGCYLLAHGQGRPVARARTSITFPQAGTWHVWVRTRNWCPGDWQPPGRFRVHVDGKALTQEFGTEGDRWHWQEGGRVTLNAAGPMSVELEDLTGFDGRCDAIYFSQEAAPAPPNADLRALADWKDRLTGRADREIEELACDVVVVGGGIAGCAAALAARSQGLDVALIQDRPVFGGNASEEVRVHTLGIRGKGGRILSTIDTPHYPNGHADAIAAQHKREATMASSGVRLFAHHLAIGLEKAGDRIASIEARAVTTGLIRRFRAPILIDATGDGWLGYWAGAEFRYGREPHTEFGEAWPKYGALWSPETPDNRVMGASVLFNSEDTGRPTDFPAVPWAMPVAKDHRAVNGEWYWEYSADDLNQVDDAERIRDHLLRAIYGSFANAKRDPENATIALKWVAHVAGRRESRRLMGDYIYTMKDMVERRQFPDAVVEEVRDVDAHHQRAEKGSPSDFLSEAMFHPTGGTYHVPFRSLYSRTIGNLMMAGRCFSCSHIGLSGPRVMKTCGQMGIATGYAAALCKKHDATPREVGQRHIGALRRLIGYEA
ncbi:MAG: FAD-dependent oxidoreductase [Isosphaeraceae bacterium]